MGDFDYGYERGWWGEDGIPYWIDDEVDLDNEYSNNSHKHSKFNEVCNFKIDYLKNYPIKLHIDLTPEYFLDNNQKMTRNLLKKIKNKKVTLDIKHNKNNSHDNKALEVYYKNIFIGYIRKNYKNEYCGYDSKNHIEDYCFYKNKFDDVYLEYINEQFILSKPISIIADRIIKNIAVELNENEKFLIDIWKWAIENEIDSIPLEKNELVNMDYFRCNKAVTLEKNIFKLTNLLTINLDGMELTNLPNEIGNLEQLNTIYLSNNYLTKLPKSFTKLSNLEIIYLDNNRFSEFPEILFLLKKIKILNLGNNHISTIPNKIGNMVSLEELDIGENNLSEIPSSIGKLLKLRILTLWDNNLTSLPNEMGNLINLEELFLNNNQLTELPKTMINLKKFTLSPYIHNNAKALEWPGKETKWYETWLFFIVLIILILIFS